MRRTYPLIAGGGPAGSAAAILLARGGARPLLIERSRGPHDVVCGGFLGGDAIRLLDRLGIDIFAMGAHRIDRVRVIAGKRIVEAALPFPAAGFSRYRLDTILIDQAEWDGARIERGVGIRHIDGGDRSLTLADGACIEAEAIFLATGKHDLRGLGRPSEAAGADPAIGLRTLLDGARQLDGVIELHLFRHGYAGLLLQEDGNANLCLSVAQSRLREAGGRPADLIEALATENPLLADRIDTSTPGDWSTIGRVPYGWRAETTTDGIFRLGDQAGVIASLAGDGVAIALASAHMASAAYLRGAGAAAVGFQADFSRQTRRPLAVAGAIRRVGEKPALAGPLMDLLRRWPSLLRYAARATRVEKHDSTPL